MKKIKVYLVDYNGIMEGLKKREEFEYVIDPRDADVLLLWQDIRADMLELCRINREYMHKPLVVVQHGVGASRDYQPPESFELMADRFCCWGTHDWERLVKGGMSDKCVVTGSPLLKRLKPKEQHTDRNIVFSPIIAMHEEPANLITFYELKKIELDFAQQMMKKHKEQLRDDWNPSIINPDFRGEGTIPYFEINKNWRLKSKLTNIHDRNLYWGSVTESYQSGTTHIEDCVKLLTQTDVVVGMVEGTLQLLAMAMDIPVVICDEWDFKTYGGLDYSKSELIVTGASAYTNIKGLRKAIEKELANPGRLSEERKKVVKRELGDVTQDADDNIVKVVKEILNG